MTRSRASAKAAGARFESAVAAWLAANVSQYIVRRVKTGAKDCGDLANLRTPGGRHIVAELKDYGGAYHVGEWLREAETERVNDGALVGLVIAKRRGVSDPGSQICLMTVRDLCALITEERP